MLTKHSLVAKSQRSFIVFVIIDLPSSEKKTDMLHLLKKLRVKTFKYLNNIVSW